VGFDARNRRGLALVFFGPCVGMLVIWCGIIALAVLSGVWPDNHIPQFVLAVWILASVVTGARLWRRGEPEGRGMQIALAPLGTLLWAGTRCWRAWKALRRDLRLAERPQVDDCTPRLTPGVAEPNRRRSAAPGDLGAALRCQLPYGARQSTKLPSLPSSSWT
jgi:hypothetical protein